MATQETVNNNQNTAVETPWYQNKWVLAGGTLLAGAAVGYTASRLINGNEVIEVIADTVIDGVSAVSDIAGNALI